MAIVIDNGSSAMRIGMSTDTASEVRVIPSVVGRPSWHSARPCPTFIGDQVWVQAEKGYLRTIRSPVQHGIARINDGRCLRRSFPPSPAPAPANHLCT